MQVSLADTAPRVQRFVTGTLSRQVLALEVIEPKYVTMESLEIILACGNSVTKCDLNAHAALDVAGSHRTHMAIQQTRRPALHAMHRL